jgi:hypothetical protein
MALMLRLNVDAALAVPVLSKMIFQGPVWVLRMLVSWVGRSGKGIDVAFL